MSIEIKEFVGFKPSQTTNKTKDSKTINKTEKVNTTNKSKK